MDRRLVLALAVLLAAPLPGDAQRTEPLAPGRITIEPFLGYRARFRAEFRHQVDLAGERTFLQERRAVEAGPLIGAAVAVPLPGRFALAGSFAYGFSADAEYEQPATSAPQLGLTDSGALLFARLGLAYQFFDSEPEFQLRRVAARAILAPALLRMEASEGADGPLAESSTHYGVAMGVDARLPLGSEAISLLLGAEDFLTFWDTDAEAERLAGALGEEFGTVVRVRTDTDATNIIIGRLGLSLRF